MEKNILKEKMNKTIDNLAKDFMTIRTGRANANILDRINVEYYGFSTPLKEVAQISTPESRVIMIKPYEQDALKMIEKALIVANLGMTPNNDGTVIRLNVPLLSEERRKQLCKELSKLSEEAKIAVRNIRRDANEQLKKNKDLSEDQRKREEKDVQKETDDFIYRIDEMTKIKEKEIMTV